MSFFSTESLLLLASPLLTVEDNVKSITTNAPNESLKSQLPITASCARLEKQPVTVCCSDSSDVSANSERKNDPQILLAFLSDQAYW